jgi:UDP-N-acetylglucosamine transferase subunit ALG13
MIFITLGTQAKDFSRLMKMAEDLVREYGLKDVIAQTGRTKYMPQNVKCIPFMPVDQYEEYVSKADVIIAHAGTGALFSSIKKGKKVIAVARLAKYGEMVNDHQTEIVHKLAGEGYILDGTNSVIDAWKQLDTFTPRPCDFECTLPQEIGKLIDEWLK